MVALFIGDDAVKQALDCAITIQRLVKKEHEKTITGLYRYWNKSWSGHFRKYGGNRAHGLYSYRCCG